MVLSPDTIRIDCVHDKPDRGMWHCGPNACWVTVTHLPTGVSARAYHRNQWKARETAMTAVELLIDVAGPDLPMFPEKVNRVS